MFPMLKQKRFQDLITGKVITVVDQFEDVAILEGKQRVNIKKLLDPSLYEETIDPETFLNGPSLMTLAEKIRSIPNEVLQNIKSEDDMPAANESLIVPYDEEEERMRLMEKARTMGAAQSMQNQLDKFSHLLDDQEPMPVIEQRPVRPVETKPVISTNSAPTENIEHVISPAVTQIPVLEDPIHKMFKNIKRKNSFTFTLTIEDKIPRPDFIEMMEDSYEVSLIDYLAQEFTDKLMSDPETIKQKIKQEITAIVFPEEQVVDIKEVETKAETKTKRLKKKDDTPVTN